VPDPSTNEPLDVATRAALTDPTVVSVFADLARLVHAGAGTDAIHQAMVDAAPLLVPGCHHASLMVDDGGRRYRTAASSDEVGAAVDALERELDEGPCVDAIESGAYQLDTDLTVDPTWPRLAERVLATTPVRGCIGYRLMVDRRKAGALNLFSDVPGLLDVVSADAGALLASFASVALAGAADRDLATTLGAGLQSNREIGTAIGLLMAAHGISADAAFATLRAASSRMNRKLADIAREVVRTQGHPTP
jgi:hypothetical protein